MTTAEQHVVTPHVGTELVNPASGTRTVFRATAASTGGAWVEVEQTYPPHSQHPPRHLHPAQDEHFTVIAGVLHAVVGDEERDVLPGEVLDVLRGTPHQMWGASDEPTVVVWRTTPALRTDRFYCDLWCTAAANDFVPDMRAAYQVTLRYAEEFQLC